MSNETAKKEPEVEKENAYVTRAELNRVLSEFAEHVKEYVQSYVELLEIRPKGEYVGHYERGRDKDAEHALNELKALLGTEALELQGKSPLIQEAAMLYILAEHKEEHITQSFIAHTYGISEVTLRQHIKKLKNLMKNKGLKLSIRYYAPENAP